VSTKGYMANWFNERKMRVNTSSDGILFKYRSHDHYKTGYNIALLMVDLRIFVGDNPRCWLRKCMKYFKLTFIPAQ
jgi:hypothetical protein